MFHSDYYVAFTYNEYKIELKYIDPEYSLRINGILFADLYLKYMRKTTLKSKYKKYFLILGRVPFQEMNISLEKNYHEKTNEENSFLLNEKKEDNKEINIASELNKKKVKILEIEKNDLENSCEKKKIETKLNEEIKNDLQNVKHIEENKFDDFL